MSEVCVITSAGARLWLSQMADVSGVTWSSRWGANMPGGCYEASWTMDLPPHASHPDLIPGRRVEVWDGPVRVWTGELTEPDRGEPWSLYARGLARVAAEYLCLDATGAPSSKPTTSVDEAIIRGLPWIRYDALSDVAFSAAASTVDLNRVDALLNAWSEEAGKRWAVFADRIVIATADPTTPKWVLSPGIGVMGVADDEYATHVTARYVSSVTADGVPNGWAQVTVPEPPAPSPAADRYGRREFPLDLTPLMLLTAARAKSLAQGRLDQASARMGWTSPIEATADELTTMGGVPARLSQIQAGDMLRINGILDADGNLRIGASVDVVLGEVRYADGAQSIYLAPVGLVPRSLSDVLAAPAAPDATFSERR